MIKTYRFFYHYNKANNGMTVHFRGTCYITTHIKCVVKCNTKYRTIQPRLVMEGWCSEIIQTDDLIIIR